MPFAVRSSFLAKRLRRALLLAGLIAAPFALHAQIPAFPGAEGYGAYSTGGRGGDVYYVTNLNSSGAGSFFDAIATAPTAGRTIVFAVSGYIRLPSGSSGTRLTKPKITIAGQTAPGDGIGFYNNFFRISASDVVLRHLRFRHGKYGSGGDCIDLDSACTNAVLDHVSMQFSTDENMSSYSTPPENLTLQYSVNAWGLETHSCGGLWDQNHATAHHTLWAHNHTRNPKARPNGLLEWINNVTYDWDIGFIMGDSYTPSSWKANVRSNYFVCPPGNIKTYILEKGWLDRNSPRKPTFSIYLDGNLMDRDGDGQLNGLPVGYERVQGSEFDPNEVVPDYATSTDVPRYYKNAAPFAGSTAGVAIDAPRLAYKKVVSSAGALRLDATYGGGLRDEVDTILFGKLVAQVPFHVTREADTGASNAGFGVLNSSAAPLDTDKDGMPDAWESALGWAPATQDHNTALASSGGILTGTTFFPANTPAGYTRLEEYLHFKASPHAIVAKNAVDTPSSLTVDLSRYTLGFNSLSPTFVLSNIVGGAAVQSGAGGRTVTFTPTLGAVGRARFEFTVTDSQGDAWTQSFLILVSSAGVPRDLVWKGDGSANAWTTANTTLNWTKTDGSAVAFSSGDNVLFDDRGSASPALSVPAGLAVGTVTFDSAQNYTLSGAGSVSASGTLTKRGAGNLTLSTANNSFASIIHEAGNLAITTSTAAGTAPINLQGGSLTLSAEANSSVASALAFNAPTVVNVTTQHNSLGNWSGAGDVTINTSALWTIAGTWSGYSGRIYFGSGNPRVRLNQTTNTNFGSASLAIDLGSGTGQFMNRNGGSTAYAIGTLTGGPNTALYGTQTGTNASTYSIGARGENATFQGSILNGGNATAPAVTHVTKVGNGTWTLTGANSTHTGNTTVSAGNLRLNGAFASSPVIVASGATLSGVGSTGGLVTVQSGGKLSPGAADGAAGTFTAAGGLTPASGSTLVFDLGATPAATSDKINVSAGTTTLAGTINFQINFLDLAQGVSAGTYPLITGNSTLTATSPVLTPVLPAATGTTRQTFSLSRPSSGTTPAFVNLVVAGDAASLVWSGASGATWDLNTTAGNFSGGSPSTFYNLDRVTFDDTGAGGSVVLAGTLQPSLLTVDSTKSYSFDGAGLLGGAMKLVKNGAGTLTLANSASNTFSGGVDLNSGVLSLASTLAPLGTGVVRLNGGTLQLPASAGVFLNNSFVFSGNSTISLGYTGNSNLPNLTSNTFTSSGNATLNLAGAGGILSINGPMDGFSGKIDWGSSAVMLRLNANSSASADVNFGSAATHFALGTGSGKLVNRNGDISIELGAVSGGPSTLLSGRQSGSGSTSTTYRVGALGLDTTFAGAINQGGDLAGLQITKTGGGVWTLSGSSDYTGAFTLESGRVVLSGNLVCSGNFKVESVGTLQLSGGKVGASALDVAPAGVVTGLGTIDGDLNNDGTVTASGPGVLVVTGDVVNDGVLRLVSGASLSASGAFVNNGVLDLLTAGGSLPPNLVNNGVVIDSSAAKLSSWSRDGTVFTLRIVSYPAHTYTLQSTDDLAAGWTNVETKDGATGVELVFTHDAGPFLRRFYRIAVGP